MTREEFIRNLKYTKEKHKNDNVSTFGTNISLMCKDMIDFERQWLTTAGLSECNLDIAFESTKIAVDLMVKALEQEKTGHWYIDERPESNRETICSNCEKPILKYHKLDFDYRPKFCPNCGAKMEG